MHLRPVAHPLHRLEGGPHEEAEPPDAVVGAVLVLRVEPAGAVEEGVVRDEVDGDRASGERRAEDADAVGRPQDRDVEGLDLLLGPRPAAAEPLGGLEEERDPDVDVVAGRGEGLRKGRSDVAEAARLGEGRDLGRKVRNAHQLSISPAVLAGFPDDGGVADDAARVSEGVTRVALRHESRGRGRQVPQRLEERRRREDAAHRDPLAEEDALEELGRVAAEERVEGAVVLRRGSPRGGGSG